MKSITKFTALNQAQFKTLRTELSAVLSKENLDLFVNNVKPYNAFGKAQLDGIFLVAELTIEGTGQIKKLTPVCTVNQDRWWNCEDEADIRIDPVDISFKLLAPPLPIEVSGSKTFLVVIEAEGNIWDSCKDLPTHIWKAGCFVFMLGFDVMTEDGSIYDSRQSDQYDSKLIRIVTSKWGHIDDL